ncbi:hypothetical protein [Desulfonatronovibrio magnus]|uniref:hypothetical protein n=1 Tax=Desulfonatronovibrio magnus TaxID=698827 RepID=UPI0012F7F798|nr:hypothetical protein [Desulfonatronovibrio magnus]
MWSVIKLGKFLGADVSESERSFKTEQQAREYAALIIKLSGVYGVMIEYYND